MLLCCLKKKKILLLKPPHRIEEEENHILMWSNTPFVNSPHYICLNCMRKHPAITFLRCHMPLIETLKDDYAWHIKTGVEKMLV